LVFLSLILIGEFISEYSKRNRDTKKFEADCKKIRRFLKNSNFAEVEKTLQEIGQTHMVISFSKEASGYPNKDHFPAIEKLATDYELRMSRQLEKTKIIATVSPMLGLMGTLIPLGPALIGLSQGDINQLANNLMIAFGTTVVGLFSGSIGYILTQVRKRWYQEDISDIDYLLEVLGEDIQKSSREDFKNEQIPFLSAKEDVDEKKQKLPEDRAFRGSGRPESLDRSC
ncbi:MAG: MotA/TolQ/ExbB proton channel family protein, partial [Methanosarcinaceae archaeon]|nr:MotA/TolQ/ExbB proton channel family protein [Methanosarcinaceae archaeon]